MGRFALGLAVATLWLSATPPPAAACPVGSPCLKYRRTDQTISLPPDHFAREGGGTVPKFDRKKLAKYLAASKWKPVFDDGLGLAVKRAPPNPYARVTYVKDTSKLRFVDPTAKIPAPGKDEHIVLIRQIERDNEGNYFVNVDGVAYQLWYCVSGKGTVACLTNTGTAFNTMFHIGEGDDSDLERPALKPMPF